MQSPLRRPRLTDEMGSPKTPMSGHTLVRRSQRPDWLVLGLGPDPAGLARALQALTVSGPAGRGDALAPPDISPKRDAPASRSPGPCLLRGLQEDRPLPAMRGVSYVECPSFFEQAGEEWRAVIPKHWRRCDSFDPLIDANILLYDGALRLFPEFWAPLVAALRLPVAAPASARGSQTVLMPDAPDRLLTRELDQALTQEGYTVMHAAMDQLPRVLSQMRPTIFLTVNFAGLDPHGETFALLERSQVPVAAWCVDNPFHALSGLKSGFWRKAHIFVTDSWYLEPLCGHGAHRVHHLPLAASRDFLRTMAAPTGLEDSLLFVGRSAFPGRDDFFAGLAPPADTMERAVAMLLAGERPDFGWWTHALGVTRLWPGKRVRLPGLGAEECGRRWRAMVLRRAAHAGRLTVCGDDAWRQLVDAPFTLLPPVDYYGPLAAMYATARCVLNATSMLLPEGLTQRHFDVWAAGGCLITDATPGLSVFPKELAEEIVFASPARIEETLARVSRNRDSLAAAWRSVIAREHTYRVRVRRLLERVLS